MEHSERAAKIISQATQWSFEGDCSLLAWMQELSQNLEQRATATNDALQQLSINVNRTATALDNAANSLTALQFTQFVESRCHDDDETVPNTCAVVPEEPETSGKTKSSTEVMEIFLRKNLDMLHNSHEKYALDFDDSDDEENGTANNYIYQPKNPYNDALLPHIYGSKLWKEHWHVGLCDGSNEYSGDEASDAFSESPSSSATDNESYESNTANLSEWASSSSIPIEHKHPAQMAMPTEPTSVAAATQAKRLPIAQHLSRDDDSSDTYSTTSRSTTTNPRARARDHDLFASLRHKSPATSTSISSSPHKKATPSTATVVQRQSNVAPTSTMLPPFIDALPPSDISVEPNVSRVNASLQPNQTIVTQTKRMPVNLFDDDDFNSFMTEAVDQTQTEVEPPAPIPAARKLQQPGASRKSIDLFAENLNEEPTEVPTQERVPPRASEKPKEIKQRKPVKLFDSPESSPPKDEFFTSARESDKKESSDVAPPTKPSITAKSLFDDDDEDDDDFLNVFGAKKLSLPQKTTGNTLLFDDDTEDVISATKQTSRLTSNLFDVTPPPILDQIPVVGTLASEEKKEADGIRMDREIASPQKNPKAPSSVDLFDDFENKVTPKAGTSAAEKRDEQKAAIPPSITSARKVFSADLFGDDDTNDLDNLLRQQSINQESIKTNVSIEQPKTLPNKEIIQQKKPLFMDEFEDEDDLFSKSLTKAKTTENVKTAKIVETSKSIAATENTQAPSKPAASAFKIASLFADDFDDEHEDDLFSVKSTTQVIAKIDSSEEKDDLISERIDLLPNATESAKADVTTYRKESQGETLCESNKGGSAFLESQTTSIPSESSIEKDDSIEKHQQQVTKASSEESAKIAPQLEESETKSIEVLSETDVQTNTTLPQANKNITDSAKIDLEQQQNYIPVVASASETITIPTTEDLQTTPSNAIDATAGSLKYSNIFLDEPPDDDDFFTTLTNNSKQMSISKLTLDLENDFYEPALPAAPTNTAAGTNTQNEGSNKHEQGSSDYGGLRLFSEIPPDDDDVDNLNFVPAAPTKDTTENANITNQRLHNVFYDDFSETLAAVQQMKENKTTAHALFDNEPPADEEQFDIVKHVANTQQKEMQERSAEERVDRFETKAATEALKDFIDEVEIDKAQKKVISSPATKDEIDRAVQKEGSESQLTAEKARSSAGKLQMPNIKINVQALLPGGGGRPSFKKAPPAQQVSELPKSASETQIPKPPADLSNDHSKATTISSTSSETLLPSICKTRARVPAGRRPSTRRARQENYRQSLIADQLDLGDEDRGHVISTQSNNSTQQAKQQIFQTPQVYANKPPATEELFIEDDDDNNDDFLFNPSHPKKNVDVKAPLSVSDKAQMTLPVQANKNSLPSFLENNDDEADDLFKSLPAAPRNTNQAHATTRNTPNITTTAPATITTKATPIKTTKTKSLFGTPSSEESDDDLFKSTKSASTTTNAEKRLPQATTTTTTTAASANAQLKKTSTVLSNNNKIDSIFGSDDEDDDDFLSNLKPNKKTTTKLLTKSTVSGTKQVATSSGGLFSDIDSDEDDLFGGKSKPKEAPAKEKTIIAQRTQLPPAAQKATTSKSLSTAKKPPTTDNPLADLLKP